MSIKELEQSVIDSGVDVVKKLYLYNSNHFWDDVVRQLNKATGYDYLHCEQIAIIAHTKGKSVVKSGNFEELKIIQSVLKEINLKTEII
ncbi:MAG TPA: Clp protease ClpS [Bacteroidetes bacterium]|nr:ATP-dependent Clp protease adaptor ClpS [Ignavibacteria bacterium]HCA41792.1 Clp protease ClpS [Bacteroidota bacterium]HCN37579.1 Clp protease ClpS [Bacteroidota bacterium]